MIDLSAVVSIVITLLVAGAVFSLLFLLIRYVGSKFPETEVFTNVANVILMVLMVLFLIGLLLNFAGYPILTIKS